MSSDVHLFSLLFAIGGSFMIGTIRVPKPSLVDARLGPSQAGVSASPVL
jgi:hypothetical protein